MPSKQQIGQLVKWNDERGFGFIQINPNQPQIFIHISALKDSKRRPNVGDKIQYSITHKKGKIQACNASIVSLKVKETRPSSSRHYQPPKHYRVPWLDVFLLSIFPLLGSLQLLDNRDIFAPFLIYPLMSLVTFKLYAEDKSRAQQKRWRIPENTLHLSELAGGWLGGFIAQQRLRHKSSKRSYQISFWGIVILHQAIWIDYVFLRSTILGTIFNF
ncbi:DUF1294 domain-containing protein [Geitlerinema sp. P-1104]|nr:DUF1294 domain-containing protein [Geitlerinema sp. P-1104]